MDTVETVRNLYLLRALPNSGKTTVGRILAGEHCYAGDDFWYKRMAETGLTYPEVFDVNLLRQAHRECQENVKAAMELGVENIAVANTNITPKEMVPYEQLATEHGYRVFYLVIERAHNGDNGHKVPPDVLDRMLSKWQWVDDAFHRRFGRGK